MILKVLKSIYSHPYNADQKWKAIIRFFKWQVNCRINLYPIIYNFTENSRILVKKGLTGATGNMYSGLMEYNDMGFLLHFLRPEDLFLDVGANIGSLTVLASGEIKARSISFEPVPSTFKELVDNIALNQMIDRVTALNIGLGSAPGIIKFTRSRGTMNHVATDKDNDTIDVDIVTLDSIVGDQNPTLLKIDVEGFETEVLRGAEKTLIKPSLKAIIIELNGLGTRYGYDESKIHEKLISLKYKAFSYDPQNRQLTEVGTYGRANTIYLSDLPFVKERVKSARKIKIGWRNKEL